MSEANDFRELTIHESRELGTDAWNDLTEEQKIEVKAERKLAEARQMGWESPDVQADYYNHKLERDKQTERDQGYEW